MSRSSISGFAFAVALGLTASAVAVGTTTSARTPAPEGKACSNRTLNGDYGFSAAGHVAGTELLSVGVVSFDANGAFELRDTLKIVGGPSLPRTIVGSYEIDEGCRGTATFHAPPPFETDVRLRLVLVNKGREAYFIQVDPDGFFQGTAKGQ